MRLIIRITTVVNGHIGDCEWVMCLITSSGDKGLKEILSAVSEGVLFNIPIILLTVLNLVSVLMVNSGTTRMIHTSVLLNISVMYV